MKWVGLLVAVALASVIMAVSTGDGAFKKKMTVSGIVTIHIAEKKTTCFVDSEANGISCLPDWFIEGKK